MVELTCDCLNIRIHAKTTSDVNFNLTNQQLADPFFQGGNLSAVTLDLAGITKELTCLVKNRSAGDWNIFTCINCRKDTYATFVDSANHNVEHIVASKALKSDPSELNELMHQEMYSPLYKIVIHPKKQSQNKTSLTLDLHTHRSEALEKTLSSLQQQLTRFLQAEQEALEERIRSYVEQQRSLYASLQNRVRLDKQAIASLLMETEEHDLENSLSEAMLDTAPGLTPPMTPINTNQLSTSPLQNSGEFREQLNSEEQDKVVTEIPKLPLTRQRPQSFNRPLHGKIRRRGVYNAPRIAQSLDTDGIFDLDGVEEELASPFFQSDDDLDPPADDGESSDDVFAPPRHKDFIRSGQMSLPINMPVWPVRIGHDPHREFDDDDDDDEEPTRIHEDPAQIAASIKAMARSVHQSDTTEMFGDLPRPRLNTMN